MSHHPPTTTTDTEIIISSSTGTIPPSNTTAATTTSTQQQEHQCTTECNHNNHINNTNNNNNNTQRYSPTVVFGKQLMNNISNTNNIPIYNVTTPPPATTTTSLVTDEEDILSPTSLAMNHLNKKKQTKRGIGLWKKTEKRLSINTNNYNNNNNNNINSNDVSPSNSIDINNILNDSINHHTNTTKNSISPDTNSNNSNHSSNLNHSNLNNNSNQHSNNNITDNDELNNILNNNNNNINGFNPFGTPEPLVPQSPVQNLLGRSFSFHALKENGNTEVVFVPHSLENSQHCFHCKDHEEELHSFEIYDKLLMNNIEYVREKTKLDSEYFKKHKQTQKPKFLLIGCSDSRVSCESIVKIDPGQIFIHRNVANIVVNTDLNLMSVLQYAVEVLEIKHIIVMGHTRCGGVKAALENTSHGLIDKWLRNIKDVYRLHKQEVDSIQDEEKRWQRMIELNVIEQTLNICKTSIIQKAWAKGKPIHVHGWVYDISSGLIQDLEIEENLWAPIESIYRLEFPDIDNYVHE